MKNQYVSQCIILVTKLQSVSRETCWFICLLL